VLRELAARGAEVQLAEQPQVLLGRGALHERARYVAVMFAELDED
jgi:hypothetical protein